MESFKCTCQAQIFVEKRSGEWNQFFIAKRLTNVSCGRTCSVFGCLAMDLLCLECKEVLGFYILETGPGLEELIGKVLGKENGLQGFFSVQKLLSTCVEGLLEVKETLLKVDSRVGKAELKTINLIHNLLL
jgi:hypothetical protein